jgi:hypothetical protein
VTGSSDSTAAGAAGVKGTITSTSAGAYSAGVAGINNDTSGNGVGVYGTGDVAGVYGTGATSGVLGSSDGGTGVFGTSTSGNGVEADSVTGTGLVATSGSGTAVVGEANTGTGVAGDSVSGTGVIGTSSAGTGVIGSSGANFYQATAVLGTLTSTIGGESSAAVKGVNKDTGNATIGVWGTQFGSGIGVYGTSSTGTGVSGSTGASSGNWAIYGNGNLGVSGTKSAVVPAQDGKGHLTLYCLESPDCWFEDFGAARLARGAATVRIDPVFAQTIHTGEYHVFVQPEGDCRGLIVRGKTATSFTVQESGGGSSDVPFAYRIVARRRDVAAPRLNRVTPPKVPPAAGR